MLRCRVDNASNDTFVQWFYDLRDWVAGRSLVYYYIENNTLQDPFYSQVFIPLFAAKGKASGDYIGITPDTRRKPDNSPVSKEDSNRWCAQDSLYSTKRNGAIPTCSASSSNSGPLRQNSPLPSTA